MVEGQEFKVIIKKSGQIFHNGELIAILGAWNKYEDLVSEVFWDNIYEKENE